MCQLPIGLKPRPPIWILCENPPIIIPRNSDFSLVSGCQKPTFGEKELDGSSPKCCGWPYKYLVSKFVDFKKHKTWPKMFLVIKCM